MKNFMAKKDKQAKHFNMRDLMESKKSNNGRARVAQPSDDIIIRVGVTFNEEFNNSLIEYNKNIANIHDCYKKDNMTVRNEILCRVFVRPLEKTEGGLIKPNLAPIRGKTQSGLGSVYVEDPFSFNLKAIVVNVPDNITDIKAGDVVSLTKDSVQKQIQGAGDDAVPMIANSFVHPDYGNPHETIMDPTNEHYGYMFMRPFNINTIL
jgi:hypothetical protein